MANASTVTMRIFRGTAENNEMVNFRVPVREGMVVLDAVLWVQANAASDLAVRWNCKAAKCGSCSAEIDGFPRLMCKSPVEEYGDTISVRPMHTFPVIRDLVTDVSWNYEVNKKIPPFTPSSKDASDPKPWRMQQEDVERVIEFRKCIECFLCQDVCHVLRNRDRKDAFFGPRFMIRAAALEMHPKDSLDRRPLLKGRPGWACATSPSAARTSARSTSTSRTTPSSRSRSGSPTSTSTRSGRFSGGAEAPRRADRAPLSLLCGRPLTCDY